MAERRKGKSKNDQSERLSAQSIVQLATAANMAQYRERTQNAPREHELHRKLKHQIKLWGGMEKIDAYLAEKDPEHKQLRGIKKIDWGFLEDEKI